MSQTRPTRKRPDLSARGDESRVAILDAARTLFAKDGFRGTSLGSVAELAGLSQAGLLHHFPSKPALLLAVLAERDREDGRLSSAKLSRRGLEILPALGTLVEHNQTTPELIRLFSVLLGEGVAPDNPGHDYFVNRYEQIRDRIARNLRLAETAGEINPGHDLDTIAALLVAVLDGLQYQWLLNEQIDMVRAYNLIADLLMKELVSAPPAARPERRSDPEGERS